MPENPPEPVAGTAPAHAPDGAAPPMLPQAIMQPLGPADPLRWLHAGWADFRAAPAIGLFYGGCFWAMALLLALVFRNRPEYVMSIASGCLLVGPFLAMGLYEASRRRERGEQPRLGDSIACWAPHLRSMALLVLVLIVLELLWGRASLVVFAVFFNTGMPSTTSVLQAIFNPDNLAFVLVYLMVGGVFALLVFSTTVVSIPMILDRDTDAVSAAITSMRVVATQPMVVLWWGALIVLLTGLALLPWGAGLLVVGPVLGHASWHAYRAAVRWHDPPPAPTAA